MMECLVARCVSAGDFELRLVGDAYYRGYVFLQRKY